MGLDVYEEEEGVFYEDRSGDIITDDNLARLMTFPNMLVTSHMGFFYQRGNARDCSHNTGKCLCAGKRASACQSGGKGIDSLNAIGNYGICNKGHNLL